MKKIIQVMAMLVIHAIVFSQYKDLPNPPADLRLMPAGSYVIAMDNTNQMNTAGNFNLRAYGLVVYLLNRNKKIKWVITAGKSKDQTDFTVTAAKIKPVIIPESIKNFSAGPFVIFAQDTSGIGILIDSFYYNPTGGLPVKSLTGNDRPSVYKTITDIIVDVRYDLYGFKPKAAILTDGGNQKIHEGFMADAGIPLESWALSLGTDLTTHCFTFASEPHNDKVNTAAFDTAIKGIRAFVEYGGNFLAQCAAVENYENNSTYGYLQTSTGILHHNMHHGNDQFINNDVSYAQYDGSYHSTQTGHLQSWDINSSWTNYGYITQYDPMEIGDSNNIGASVSKITDPAINGGLVYYLGNHDFTDLTHLEDINGIRMYMNAFLTPVNINPSCRTGDPLHVSWYSFSATRVGTDVLLEWITATEKNSLNFYAERSTDGIHFVQFGVIPGLDNNNAAYTYRIKDVNPGKGVFYYRIRQTDSDGNTLYSVVRVVHMNNIMDHISILPNPGHDVFTIMFDNDHFLNARMNVYDNTGKLVIADMIIRNFVTTVDLSDLQPGVYTAVFNIIGTPKKITTNIIITQ